MAKKQEKKSRGKRHPLWWELMGGQYRLNLEKVDRVRQVFELSANGFGAGSIVEHLEANNVPTITGKKWNRGYVDKILRTSFELTGIDKDLYDRAQDARRVRPRGRCSPTVSSLFAGKVYINERKANYRPAAKNLYPAGKSTEISPNVCIPYLPFERCVLDWIKEVEISIDSRLDKLSKLYRTKESINRVHAKTQGECDRKNRDLLAINAKIKSTKSECDVGGVFSMEELIELLKTTENKEMIRRQLRQQVGLLVDRIDIKVSGYKPRQLSKTCDITVTFVNGRKRFLYMRTDDGKLQITAQPA